MREFDGCNDLFDLYRLDYYSEVKERNRTCYEVYIMRRTEEVPEGYEAGKVSFFCFRSDEAYESPNTLEIIHMTANKNVVDLEGVYFH